MGEMPLEEMPPEIAARSASLSGSQFYAQVRQHSAVSGGTEKAITRARSERVVAWNRSLPVNRLPNELLVSIFADVQLETANGPHHTTMPFPDLFGPPYPTTKWMALILVCRYWRDVVYGSPTLWRNIFIRSLTLTQHALMLSSSATVDVMFGFDSLASTAQNLQLLQQHTRRLRSLVFVVIWCQWNPAVLTLLRSDGGMPALETLQLPFHTQPRERWDNGFVDLQLTPERFPRLRWLALALTAAPSDIHVYARLRHLSLRDCRCDFSLERFLEVLSASTNLEHLQLESFLHRIEGDWMKESADTGRNPHSLRYLKFLKLIEDSSAHTSNFLARISLSSTASVSIYCLIEADDNGDLSETITDILPSYPAVALPALALVTEVVVQANALRYSISGFVEPRVPGKDLIFLQIADNPTDPEDVLDWGQFPNECADDLLDVFASAPLTALNFTGSFGNVSAHTWGEIFTRYPLLKTLRLDDDLSHADESETVFQGLLAATPPPDSPVPCPRLRSVSLKASFSRTDIDAILKCLRHRAGEGHRLEHLRMDFDGDEDNKALMDAAYLPELRELVSDVDYKYKVLRELVLPLSFVQGLAADWFSANEEAWGATPVHPLLFTPS